MTYEDLYEAHRAEIVAALVFIDDKATVAQIRTRAHEVTFATMGATAKAIRALPEVALRAWNSNIARARHEYETAPSRACRWNTYDKPCWTPRRDDPTYCNKHRATANKRAAKKAEWRRMDRARRRAAA